MSSFMTSHLFHVLLILFHYVGCVQLGVRSRMRLLGSKSAARSMLKNLYLKTQIVDELS